MCLPQQSHLGLSSWRDRHDRCPIHHEFTAGSWGTMGSFIPPETTGIFRTFT